MMMYNHGISISKYSNSLVQSKFDSLVSIVHNVLIVLIILLLIAGDVERNPGPVQSTIKICHSNIRNLNASKLEHINFDLCPYFDIICLSETNLHNNRIINFDVDLPGF